MKVLPGRRIGAISSQGDWLVPLIPTISRHDCPLTKRDNLNSFTGMTQHVHKIEEQAALLSKKERAELVRRLIASLDRGDDIDSEQAWLDEAERRLSAYVRGDSSTMPAEVVFDALLSSH